MASIFISYSRVDLPFVENLYRRIQRMRPNDKIWYDKAPHGLLGGDSWWDEILDAIADADIFIYVLSNESVQSSYCHAEFQEARRLQKRIITIQARDRTKLTDELRDIQYVDMKAGADDPDALVSLSGALDRQASLIKKKRPLWRPRTPKPNDDNVPTRDANAPDIETPTLKSPVPDKKENDNTLRTAYIGGMFLLVSVVIAGIFGLWQGVFANNVSAMPTTAIAQSNDDSETTNDVGTAFLPSETPQPTQTPTPTPTATYTPTLSATDIEGTVQAQMNAILQDEQATVDAQATATSEQALQLAIGTQTALTATASVWTATPTVDTRATAQARLTATALQAEVNATSTQDSINATGTQVVLDADAKATQDSANATATATLWTLTPTLTPTPTSTNTPLPTLSPLEEALQRARNFTGTQNSDWVPIEADFDGVTMVLVPAGCFMMGSDTYNDEQPVHEQCFDKPFWIDKYEVTNTEFASYLNVEGNQQIAGYTHLDANDADARISLVGESWIADEGYHDDPVVEVTWWGADAYCAWRNAQLPTETHWEYAARGVEAWVYPWGNDFVGDNVVYSSNSGGRTNAIGSRLAGASWVGALDMAGNVLEWTSSLYEPYPYDANDGRERDTGGSTDVQRVLRGGSWGDSVALDLRGANRNGLFPTVTVNFYGFRCFRFDLSSDF
jgi:formylglycine-generating enzyme required for sulfatase activity